MAAGLGTRLKPFTDLKSKALLPVMGIPISQFSIDALTRAGVREIVANIHHHAEESKSELMSLDLNGAKLTISDESSLLCGSAGGIRKALPHFCNESFFVINADVLSSIDLNSLAICHSKLRARHGVRLTLALLPGMGTKTKENYREIFFDPQTQLIAGLGELVQGKPFFMGAAVLEADTFSEVPPEGPSDFVKAILEPAIRDQKAGCFLTTATWNDIGSPSLWLEAHLSLIEQLETGNSIPANWRQRIESCNRRMGEKIWVSRGAPHRIKTSDWIGPCYWNHLSDDTAHPPEVMGPSTIVYGSAANRRIPSNSICYRGLLVKNA